MELSFQAEIKGKERKDERYKKISNWNLKRLGKCVRMSMHLKKKKN